MSLPIIPLVMHQVLRIARNSFRKYWNFSIYCLLVGCSVRCARVSSCAFQEHDLQDLQEVVLVRAETS